MEENKEQEELNNLRREGRIDVEDVKNKSTTSEESIKSDSLEQIIDEDSLLEAANQNSTYINMLEPCSMEGINITKRLKKYFEENKVKPEELVEEIRRQMSVIRKDINQNTQNLFFDEFGKIDVELSIEKARKNGAKIPNYIKAIDEEISNETIEGDKREPFLINGVDVYKQIEEKSEEFWENLQKEIDDRFKKLDEEYNIEEAVSKIDKEKSDKNKEFKAGFQTISNLARNIPIVKDRKENSKNLLKVLYLYQECKQLNLDEVEGLSEEEKKKIGESIDKLKEILKYRFSETSSLDIESVNFKELAESLNFNEKEIKELLKEFKDEFRKEFSKQTENDKSYSELNEENKIELEKRDLIRRIKLYKTFTELPSTLETYEKMKEFYQNLDVETMNEKIQSVIEQKYPGLIEEAEKEYEQDNLMPIFAEIVKRNHLFKRFSEFKKAEDISEKDVLSKELLTIIDAIDFITKEDVYEKSGESFPEDIRCNNQAVKIIKEVFPESILESTENKQRIDMQKLMLQFKERYGSFTKIEQINNVNSLIEYTRMRTALNFGALTARNALDKNEEEQKGITEILNDKEILKEVEKKNSIQEKLVIKEKKFSIFAEKIGDFLNRKNALSDEEKIIFVKYLSIVTKEYSEESDKEKYLLYDIAKTELSHYLPNVFDNRNAFHLEKIDEEVVKYIEKNGKHIDNPTKFLEEESKRIDAAIEKSYKKEELKRNPKALAEKISASNMESISVLNQTQKQEKLLKFIAFVRRASHIGKINSLDTSTNEALTQIEEKVKENLEEIFVNRKNPQKEVEDCFERIYNYSNDDDFVQSMIRSARGEYAKENKVALLGKYKKENKITNEDDIKKILTLYLGTKNDTRNSIMNLEKNSIIHRNYSVFFEKISPELVQKNEIKEDALLKFYNEIYHTDFTNIEEVYIVEENRLLENVVTEVANDVQKSKNTLYAPRTMAGIITSNNLEIHNNMQAEAFKERDAQITNTIDLMEKIQKLSIKDIREGLSSEEVVELLKNTVTTIAFINEEKKIDSRFETTELETKYFEFREKSMELLEGSLQKFFLDVKPKDGKFDLEFLSQKCEEYFASEGITIDREEGQSTVEALLEEFEQKKKQTIGPVIPKTMLEKSMKKRIDGIDLAIKEWEEFRKEEKRIADMSWEEAEMDWEEIDASLLGGGTYTHEGVHATSDEYDKDEFPSPIEAVNEIRAEEIKVSTQQIQNQEVLSQDMSSQEGLNIDNHPVLLKKSNLFTRAFKKLGKLIKDSIDNFKNGYSSNHDITPEVVPIKTIDRDEEIKRLTGYGKQEIDFSRISSSKTGEQPKTASIEEKRNSGSEVGDK